jgi:cell division inhibitor SulA
MQDKYSKRCMGQTHVMPLLDERGKSVRCQRWLEIQAAEEKKREREWRRRGGLSQIPLLWL